MSRKHRDAADTNPGFDRNKPKLTIGAGILAAKDSNSRFVLVAEGDYTEQVVLADGIHVFGGYDKNSWERDFRSTKTVVKASNESGEIQDKTIIARNLKRETVLSGLEIRGPDVKGLEAGASTFAVWAVNSDNLHIEHSNVKAGEAAEGREGFYGSENFNCERLSGGGGGPDTNAKPCDKESPKFAESGLQGELRADDDAVGGLGGVGGPGAEHVCAGDNGTKAGNGTAGKPGGVGKVGTHGKASDRDVVGTFEVSGTWVAAVGAAARDGERGGGGGGGGGGAGGNYEIFLAGSLGNLDRGGRGGQGGQGGCGGQAGENGQAGGSSFGIAVIGGKIGLFKASIELGKGGEGGDGGQGAPGQVGVTGGDGNKATNDHLAGNGGNGGKGATVLVAMEVMRWVWCWRVVRR